MQSVCLSVFRNLMQSEIKLNWTGLDCAVLQRNRPCKRNKPKKKNRSFARPRPFSLSLSSPVSVSRRLYVVRVVLRM